MTGKCAGTLLRKPASSTSIRILTLVRKYTDSIISTFFLFSYLYNLHLPILMLIPSLTGQEFLLRCRKFIIGQYT